MIAMDLEKESVMGRGALSEVTNAVFQQIQDAGMAACKEGLLISLPVYLDATEVQLLQMELNSYTRVSLEIRHRPGERRVWVQLASERNR